MSDINDLLVVQESMTSSDGAVGPSFFEMRHLLQILQAFFRFLGVRFDIISFFLQLSTWLIKFYRLPIPLLPGRTLTTESKPI